jgi:hypothetical protein
MTITSEKEAAGRKEGPPGRRCAMLWEASRAAQFESGQDRRHDRTLAACAR